MWLRTIECGFNSYRGYQNVKRRELSVGGLKPTQRVGPWKTVSATVAKYSPWTALLVTSMKDAEATPTVHICKIQVDGVVATRVTPNHKTRVRFLVCLPNIPKVGEVSGYTSLWDVPGTPSPMDPLPGGALGGGLKFQPG